MRKLEPLSLYASDLLRAERDVEPTPLDQRRRVLAKARFAQRLVPTPKRLTPALTGKLVVGMLTLAVGAAAAAALRTQLFALHPNESSLQGASRTEAGRTASTIEPSAGQTRASTLVGPNTTEPKRASPATPLSTPQPAAGGAKNATATEQLDRELALLKRARSGVSSGNYSSALDSLNEHSKRFPSGRLREEREALRVTALWNGGKRAEARRAAARFIKLFPRSVLAPQMAEKANPQP